MIGKKDVKQEYYQVIEAKRKREVKCETWREEYEVRGKWVRENEAYRVC